VAFGCCRRSAAASFLDPARDEAGIGSGIDAQLGGSQVMGFVQVALMAADRQSRVFGQQVGPPVRNRGQFRDRVLQFRLSEGMGAGMAASGTGDLGDDDAISFCRSHPASIERRFDSCP
jgi:hypothetical protein